MATLTRYTPENGITRLPDMIDQLFRESFVMPSRFERFFEGKQVSNLLETESTYIVQIPLPGLDLEKLQIQVVGSQFTIKGVCNVPKVESSTYLWNGFTTGEFSEVFTLPMEVDGEKADAKYEFGILILTLPKAEHAKPKMIKVHVAK